MNEDDLIISSDTQRTERIPPGQHPVEKFPVLHEGAVQNIDESEWNLKIFGMVKRKITLSFREMTSLPMIRVYSDVHCVTGWSKLGVTWEGIGIQSLKGLVSILPEAKFVMVHCAGGYSTNLSLEYFFGYDVLFALKRDGESIGAKFGHPIRLIVPRLYYWKSAKWVNGIEFMTENKPGFWESRGYHIHGDPWKEERYSR